nr:glucosaminidase domain-containing protein [Lentimicrobium sp. S6]
MTENSAYFPSVLIAQGILESNYGRSRLSAIHHAYFGIKAGSQWKGKTVNLSTGEVINGNSVTITDDFRVYESPEQSIKDRINWMMDFDRYNEVEEAKTPEAQAIAIQNAGYATDPNYANKIINIIDSNNLKQFDKNRDIMKNISLAISILLLTAAALTMYKTLKY